ncbi:MAG: DUF1616 domain-containing protein [Chloroflexi bacterium]|nr:DUF1616 domain-containing protein [Chloroflexota bacterium]
MDTFEALRIFPGAVFVLLVPGLAWSYVFFRGKTIDWLERAALSFGLSVALVPITVFWLNFLFHMKITVLSTSLTIGGLTLAALACLVVKKRLASGKTGTS